MDCRTRPTQGQGALAGCKSCQAWLMQSPAWAAAETQPTLTHRLGHLMWFIPVWTDQSVGLLLSFYSVHTEHCQISVTWRGIMGAPASSLPTPASASAQASSPTWVSQRSVLSLPSPQMQMGPWHPQCLHHLC